MAVAVVVVVVVMVGTVVSVVICVVLTVLCLDESVVKRQRIIIKGFFFLSLNQKYFKVHQYTIYVNAVQYFNQTVSSSSSNQYLITHG